MKPSCVTAVPNKPLVHTQALREHPLLCVSFPRYQAKSEIIRRLNGFGSSQVKRIRQHRAAVTRTTAVNRHVLVSVSPKLRRLILGFSGGRLRPKQADAARRHMGGRCLATRARRAAVKKCRLNIYKHTHAWKRPDPKLMIGGGEARREGETPSR